MGTRILFVIHSIYTEILIRPPMIRNRLTIKEIDKLLSVNLV